MARYTIQAPDGRKITVEAENESLAMQGAQEWVSSNPVARQTKDLQAGLSSGQMRYSDLSRPEQDAIARSERTGPGDAIRSVARGVPFLGEWLDEASASTNAALGGYIGGSQAPTYEQRKQDNLAYERARDRTADEDAPIGSFVSRVAGGVAGTLAALPSVAGAGLGAAAGRLGLGVGAKTLPGAVARGAIAGGLQGAAAGAGAADEGFVDRSMGALQGGAIGGAIGGVAPLAFEFGRRGLSSLGQRVMPREATPLNSLSSGAQRFVGDISDPASVSRWQSELSRLGDNAMLADVSPEWAGIARGAAARPGSRGVVVDTLAARDAAKNARLAVDLDQSLGRAPVPSNVEAGLEASRRAVGPQYGEAFGGASAVDTAPLAGTLDEGVINTRGPAQSAMRRVREMLNIPGVRDQLDPNPQALMSTRQAIDGMLATEQNPDVVRALTMARGQVDDLLAQSVPGLKPVDARYAELARQSEALRRGGMVMDSGKTAVRPAELAQELQQGALPQGEMIGPSAVPLRMQQGVRAEIDRIAGTNANDPVALQRYVKGEGDWNRQKLGQAFGQDQADAALAAIDRESQFRNTFNRVTGGSDTAQTQGFRDFLDRAENPVIGGGAAGDMTAFGAAMRGAKWVGGALAKHLGKERADRYATELARTAIATGLTRDQFVSALEQAGVRQQAMKAMVDLATRTGLIGSREAGAAIGGRQNGR